VLLWRLDRGWSIRRICEAWVVWRHGPMHLAEQGDAAAGPLNDDDPERLRRAATRYERHVDARPEGFPDAALAALAAIARIAAARDSRPVTLHYAIRLLDQLSRRMRASATVADPKRRDRQAKRARARRDRLAIVTPQMQQSGATWLAELWPFWVACDDDGEPILVDGELQLDSIYGSFAPKRSDPEYERTLRDAQLLAGWHPSDGRAQMAAGDASRGGLTRRRAKPGPYQLKLAIRGPRDPADVELARLADITLQQARRRLRRSRGSAACARGPSSRQDPIATRVRSSSRRPVGRRSPVAAAPRGAAAMLRRRSAPARAVRAPALQDPRTGPLQPSAAA